MKRATDSLRRLAGRASWPFELVFLALVTGSVVPLWLVRYPPIEDLPQHLAAIRVLHSLHDPAFGLAPYFELTLSRTQYLAYYLAADLLSYPLGVRVANLVLVTAAVAGTPLALRALLRALGRDEKLALFALPLAYNAHLILGFFNFLAAIPLAFAGLALAVRLRERFTRGRALALAAITFVTFYTHVVPFAFLGLGAALVALGGGLRATVLRLATLVPAGLAALVWAKRSPAGQATATAALGSANTGPQPTYAVVSEALRDLPNWLTDVFHRERDAELLVATLALFVLAVGLGARPAQGDAAPSPDDALRGALTRRLAILSPLALVLYFVTPTGYDWIWPISARFPLLALLFAVPVLPTPRRFAGVVLAAALTAVSVFSFVEAGERFVAFEREEVGELDEALAAIPAGRRVAGLMFDKYSQHAKFAAFLHFVAYYQADKGGAVMFTFADFPQSPFRFREGHRPPRVEPRWEWTPERVDPRRDLAWYEYVLARGPALRLANDRTLYEPVFRGPRWSVWRRLDFRP
jgi:hypothetical protein